MYMVTISISPVREGERASGSVAVEEKQGDFWKRVEVLSLISNTADQERKLLLSDRQRIVVEGSGAQAVVYDREQNAAVVVTKTDEEIEARIVAAHERQVAEDEAAEHRRLLALDAAKRRLEPQELQEPPQESLPLDEPPLSDSESHADD